MPRQNQPLPWRVNRFNYWRFAEICPQVADERQTFSPSWVRKHSNRVSVQQFSSHQNGRPCGVAGCLLDKQLAQASAPSRALLALRRYIETDRLWQQDREAWKVFKRLPAQQQKTLNALDRKIRGHMKRRNWFQLLKNIATDQKRFEEIITEKRSGSLSEAQKKVYRPYSRQRQELLGNITSRLVKQVLNKKRVMVNQIDRPTIPRSEPVEVNMARPMFDRTGNLINYDDRGNPIDEKTRDQMVFHWFAHALRNLSRYIDGNRPLLWKVSCRVRCIRERNKRLLRHLRHA